MNIMRNSLLLTLIALSIFIGGCSDRTTFNDREINNPHPVELPIDSSNEAIQYSLSFDQVRSELNKPLEGELAQYKKYDWWATSSKLDSSSYVGKEAWSVHWFKGPGECQSPYGCHMDITSDGIIISNLSCSSGWDCK